MQCISAFLAPTMMALVFVAAPPLTDQQRSDLATARDDADHREQAFFSLVEAVREWPDRTAVDDEPIRLAPDFSALVVHPTAYRGDLCRIAGELVQQTPLAPPYEDVSEWFVRDERTLVPAIVFVIESPDDFHDRQQVQIDARFYKRMRFTARDGKVREYPAFVGRFPTAISPAAQPQSSPIPPAPGAAARGLDLLAILAGPIAALVIVLIGLRAWAMRKGIRPARMHPARIGAFSAYDDTAVDDVAGLPDDPAEALAELRRRALTAHESSPEHARDQGQSSR